MLKNYIKTAYRNLVRNQWFTLINIVGLAGGMSICLLIISMIKDQQDYDQFHEKGNRIYRVISERPSANATFATSPPPLYEVLKEQIPSIEKTVQLRRDFYKDISWQSNAQAASGFYTDDTFFEIFDFKLKYGNATNSLVEPYSMILAEEMAEKLGVNNGDFIGEVIKVKDLGEFKLTGIVSNKNLRSHLNFDVLVAKSTLVSLNQQGKYDFNPTPWEEMGNHYLYLLLKENANPKDLEKTLTQTANQHYENSEFPTQFQLQALHDIAGTHLVNNLSIAVPNFVMYALAFLAFLVLLTACFNYTNLTVAKSITRSKEIGIRKVIGARKSGIFFQFLMESIVLTLLALLLAATVLEIFIIPQFKSLFLFEALDLRLENDWRIYTAFAVFAILTGIIAGSLPSFYLSRFQPIQVLKTTPSIKIFSKLGWRKVLTISQFVITVLFFVSSIILYQQTKLLLHADYGFDKENVLNISLKEVDYEKVQDVFSKNPAIKGIAGVSLTPGLGHKVTDIVKRSLDSEEIVFDKLFIDENYIKLMDIQLLAGRNIAHDDPQDFSQVIINASALNPLGFENPQQAIGQEIIINQPQGPLASTVIGVTKDIYNYLILQPTQPLFFVYQKEALGTMSLKIQSTNIPQTIDEIKSAWATIAAEIPIDYHFYDEQLDRNLAPLSGFVSIIGFLTFITIIITSLGLLGLASYNVETRKKEIGIRKVLGADFSRIIWTLSKGMIYAILIALLIGLPLALFLNNLWLQHIANRVTFNILNVGVGAIGLLSLTLVIVFSQVYKVVYSNPVEVLKVE